MKTLSSIFFAIIAIAAAIYNNPYMLSRFTRLTKHFTSTRDFTTTSTDMASNGMFRGLPVIPDEQFTTTAPRKIAKSFLAIEQSEGAGARVRRSVGTPKLRNFSPFLMLDHFAIPPGTSTAWLLSILYLQTQALASPTTRTADKRPSHTSSLAQWTTKTSQETKAQSRLEICSS